MHALAGVQGVGRSRLDARRRLLAAALPVLAIRQIVQLVHHGGIAAAVRFAVLARIAGRLAERNGRFVANFLRAVVQRSQQGILHAGVTTATDGRQVLDGLDLLRGRILVGLNLRRRLDGRIRRIQVGWIGYLLQGGVRSLSGLVAVAIDPSVPNLVESLRDP